MTRPTKREIEKRIEEFEIHDAAGDLEIVLEDTTVMSRERAEEKGREILEPFSYDARPDADLVVVERNTDRVVVEGGGR